MTEPFQALERSLRDGPPDEGGYEARRRELEMRLGARSADGIMRVQRVIPMPRVRPTQPLSLRMPIAALLAVAVAIGGFALAFQDGQPSVIGPLASSTPGPTRSPADSQVPRPTAPRSAGPSVSELTTTPPIPIPPLTLTFVSTRNGFSIKYPAEWTATPATRSWLPDNFPARADLDRLAGSGEARLEVASQAMAAGQTEDEWVAAYFHPYQGSMACANASDLPNSPRLPIDGQAGYLDIAGCPVSSDVTAIASRDVVYEVFAFAGTRVYQITLDGDVDQAYFEALLATVKLDPASALDPPGPP